MSDEGQYRELFENAADIIYAHDLEGRFTSVNKAVERLLGYSRTEVMRIGASRLLEPGSRDRALEIVRQLLGGGPPVTFEVVVITRDRRRISLEVNSRLVFVNGVPDGVQGIARDVTERRRAEAIERDRNRVLEQVAGNEPLAAILGSVAHLVEEQISGVRCSVVVWHQGRLRLAAAPALPASYAEAFVGPEVSPAAGAYSAVLKKGTPAVVDLKREPSLKAHRDLLGALGFRTCHSVPVMSGVGNPLGAFLLYCEEGCGPGEGDAPVLDAARRLAIVAIEHWELTDQLSYQASHDVLTGLPNRLCFEQRLEEALEEARRHHWLLAVFFIDLDRFKQVNDTLGHPTGDMVLRQVAARLVGSLRKSDNLARLGGDEFGLLLAELNDAQDAFRVGQKLLDALGPPFQAESQEVFLTASIGISVYPRDGRDAAALQRNADTAMYRAKNRGRNHAEFFMPELGIAAAERMDIETALRRALEHEEFELYYQPQVAPGGQLTGWEALLVWNHPKLGTTPPQQFIPVAEDSGMIVSIGAWALGAACRQSAAWQKAGLPRMRMAVNVSPMQFSRPDFVETVAQTLAESELDPGWLELELTESVVMRDLEESTRQMERLRALGVGISIDDFGTGYSSLSYLRRLPINALKIDRSFLKEVGRDPNTLPLVQAIVTLAHGLGLTVVAEGVETARQFEMLKGVGCDRFQGYLLGEPLAADAAGRLLAVAGPVLR